jgi:Leucine-rich repeat (LRR) protein
VPTGDINELIAKGEQFKIKRVNGLLTLNLSNKSLKNLGGIANIPGIETVQFLYLNSNQLKSLQGMPVELPALEMLYLYGNQLKSLQGMPEELLALRVLYLGGNELESLQGMPAELPALRQLYLDHNQLVSLQGMSKYLPALRELYLNSNQLSDEVKREIRRKYPFAVF